MKERAITINGTGQQVMIREEQVMDYKFIAADSDGELWLYEKEPTLDMDSFVGFKPDGFSDCDIHGDFIKIDGDEWVHSCTPIKIVFDPEAMADAVESVIRQKYSQLLKDGVMQDLDLLVNDVKALIKAGN